MGLIIVYFLSVIFMYLIYVDEKQPNFKQILFMFLVAPIIWPAAFGKTVLEKINQIWFQL